jgi:hypothetical protein
LKTTIALAVVALGVITAHSFAATAKHKAKAASTTYQCVKCHMKFDAATAKKDHYKDPMDGGKLVAVKSHMSGTMTHMPSKGKPMGGMNM